MIEIKLIELRDAGTFLPMFAARMQSGEINEDYLLYRAGYPENSTLILFGNLEGGEVNYDPRKCSSSARTRHLAHQWIEEHWNEITSGQLIDVQYILGETPKPKVSERIEHLAE